MIRFSVSFEEDLETKLDKISKKLRRNRSDTLRELVRCYEI